MGLLQGSQGLWADDAVDREAFGLLEAADGGVGYWPVDVVDRSCVAPSAFCAVAICWGVAVQLVAVVVVVVFAVSELPPLAFPIK